jgi:dihydrofolate reductase
MRTVVVTNIISLDGYYADVDGNPLALNMDAAFDAYNLERMRHADVVLLGADSFQMFSSFWPFVADAPADPANPALSDTNRAFSRRYNELPKVVVSDSYTLPADNPWHDTTTVVSRAELGDWLASARAEGDGDIAVFASHVTWNAMLAQGEVDEVHLVAGPSALGDGVPVFTGPAHLAPLEVRALEGSDNVLLRYAQRRRDA